MGINTFREVVDILDTAVSGPGTEVGPPHHAFWRDITRDEFVATKVLSQPILVLGDGAHSNLILSLKGQPPFGSGPDAEFPRMPVGFDPVPDDSIRSIELWINDGCPDGSDAAETAASKPNLGRFGSFGLGVTPQQAKDIEALGYGAIWVGNSPPAELAWVEPILEATTTLQAATGIANIWTAPAKPVADSFHRIDKAYPGRFLLGIGVGHREIVDDYRKPYDALVEYLDQLDEYGVPANRRVMAAQGPRVLKLSAERSAGAFPYQTTPQHTAHARELMGPSAFLATELKVVLTTDSDEARAVGRRALDMYFNLVNFRNSWKRQGFSEEEVVRPGSDRLVDAMVAYGTADQIAARLKEQLDAGADHVAVEVLTEDENLVSVLAELAGPLGLTQS